MNSKNSLEQNLSRQRLALRKYQILLAVFILTTLVLAGFLFAKSGEKTRGNNLEGLSKKASGELESALQKYSYLDPTRNLLKQKDAITNIQPLRDILNAVTKREEGNAKISLYFEFLNTGANIDINKDEKIWPVSLAKLPLAMLALKKVENGDWNEDLKMEVLDENINGASGNFYKSTQTSQHIELWRLLTEMMINSDNTAYRIVKRNTTLEERQRLADEIGLGELFEDQGKVSAKEYSRLLRALYTASYLNRENSQKLLKLLTENNFIEFLNLGMPRDIEFAHKQGENIKLNVYADSGIVYYDSRPYIISVMVEPTVKKEKEGKEYAKNIMKEVSSEVYSFVKNK